MRIYILAICFGFLAGCGDDGDEQPAEDTSDTVTEDTNPTVPTTADLAGIIAEADGSPISGANIRFCRGAQCRYLATGGDGAYHFGSVAVARHSFEVVPPVGSDLTTVFSPLIFGDDEFRIIDVTIPTEGTRVLLPGVAAEVALDEILITIGANTLIPPSFADEATHASATLVPSDDWIPTDGVTGIVVAIWYLMPFDHHTDGGMPLRFDLNSLGLTGGEYRAYISSYELSTWEDLGVVTDGGDGIYGSVSADYLSTILLVDES